MIRLKRSHVLLCLLVVSALAGLGYYGYSRAALAFHLNQARAAVGSRNGSAKLQVLLKSYPDSAELNYLYGRQLRMEGRLTEATIHLNQAVDGGWNRAQVDRERLLVQAQTDPKAAESGLQLLLDQNPFDEEILLAQCMGWSQLLNVKKAELLVNAVIERDPGNGLAHCLRGRIMLQRGQPYKARPDLEEACQLGAKRYYYPDARLLLANCLLDLGRFEEALQRFRECRVEEPDNLKVLLGEARCYWFLDRWEEAAKVFREMLQRDPEHLDALSQLAYILEEQGDLPEARKLLERAIKADATWADLSFRLAEILAALGETDQAGEYQQRAEKLKLHYAKPRTNPFPLKNAYAGEEAKSIRGSSGP
jgi:tetratricopeptide (TPR) repeat protein